MWDLHKPQLGVRTGMVLRCWSIVCGNVELVTLPWASLQNDLCHLWVLHVQSPLVLGILVSLPKIKT